MKDSSNTIINFCKNYQKNNNYINSFLEKNNIMI